MTGFLALFNGFNASGNTGLWVTDGTAQGTQELDVAGASKTGFNPGSMVSIGGKVLFSGLDANGFVDLWESDGTAAGTRIVPVSGGSSTNGLVPLNLVAYGGKVLFRAFDANFRFGLWQTDGTAAGTSSFTIADAAAAGAFPSQITGFGASVLFAGKNASNLPSIGIADPAGGTGEMLAVAGAAAGGLNPQFIAALGGSALFQGTDAAGLVGLWATDGTAAGTVPLAVGGAAAAGLRPVNLFAAGGFLLFNGRDGNNAPSLWVSDGTAAGTARLAVAGASSAGLAPASFTAFGGQVYFAGTDTAGRRGLWVTDGTSAGTREIPVAGAFAGLPGLAGGVNPSNIIDVGTGLLFEGLNGAGQLGLWMTDGTSAGTVEITAGAGAAGLTPTGLTLLQPLVGAPCYVADTRIRVPWGEAAVQSLRPGGLVMTAAGMPAAIAWLGHRRIDCRAHPRPPDVWPVRIAAGAFAGGIPVRDLWLSPDHAVFVDGVLIPVRHLLNGATIAQHPRDSVEYWHVELGRHDVLLAEGLPAESYLDTGNRGTFANGGTVVQLAPDFALGVWARDACAPLVRDGARLAAVRARLLARAMELGHRLVREPALHAVAGPHAIRPSRSGLEFRFRLPPATHRVVLQSRSAVPAQTRRADPDHRMLGIFVQSLRLDGAALALTDPRLRAGWHQPEHGGAARWTDGAGVIESEAAIGAVSLAIAPLMSYWADAPVSDPAARRSRC